MALSTSSVYPGSTASGFDAASRLGYDGVEVMVGTDDVSADIEAVRELSELHHIPIVSVHAPTLLLTQHVWGIEPWGKLHRAAEMALEVGAETVVAHPPFRWQQNYGRGFVEGIAELERQYGIHFAVENMYPWRAGGREFQAYAPDWDPVPFGYANVTVDVSHAATAGQDSLEMAKALGSRLRHVHMTDGSGSFRDEHLVPGQGRQPCAGLLTHLVSTGFDGEIVVEISTRRAKDQRAREADLVAALAFCREALHHV